MTAPTHACPCGCGAPIARNRLACRAGWRRLPARMRRAVMDAWQACDTAAHTSAVAAALTWYRENQLPAGAPRSTR